MEMPQTAQLGASEVLETPLAQNPTRIALPPEVQSRPVHA